MIHLIVEGQSWQRIINGCNRCKSCLFTRHATFICRRQSKIVLGIIRFPLVFNEATTDSTN
jgi:hypothetical protein